MVSRRHLLLALAATGVSAHRPLAAVPNTDPQTGGPTPNFPIPAQACDCHVHVFGDTKRFPFSPDRPYTPPPAPVSKLSKLLRRLHMDRVVIVSPAVYSTNNECTLDAVRQLGFRARGIALVAAQTADSELDRLQRGGICGIRLNFETLGVTDPEVAGDRFQLASKQAAERAGGTFRSTPVSRLSNLCRTNFCEVRLPSSSTTLPRRKRRVESTSLASPR
jgi:hypothetical protein